MAANEYIEHRQEGWVKYRRCYCKDGFIDIWNGDSINNPNKAEKSHLALNASAQYYRLNGKGEWINSNKMRGMWEVLNKSFWEFSAQDIWDFVSGKVYDIK